MVMRVCFGILVLLSVINVAEASHQSLNTNLIEQIKPNLTTRSKPTSVKLASVSFLKTDKGVDFSVESLKVDIQCGNLGYTIPVSQCTGDMKPSHLCSSDSSMKNVTGANQYTSGCCNSNIYTATNLEGCSDNSTALASDRCYWGGSWKYRCACDRSRYPYSTISGEGCGSTGAFNVNNSCQAYEPSTNRTETYYIGCCPNDYKPCDGQHQVGNGNSCRIKVGNTIENRYESCSCAMHYDTICTNGKLIDVTNYCSLDNGVTKFTTESNCESNCTKTIETNIDEYLFNYSWHCLYRKEGATIKTVEDQSGVCGIYDTEHDKGEYDECAKQGFVKSVDDCSKSLNIILRCPNDTSKVWCLEGKYCTGYDVGSYGGQLYCTIGADVDFCDTSDQGKRCQYKNDVCNCTWDDGNFNSSLTSCLSKFSSKTEAKQFFGFPADPNEGENYELSDDGNDLTCCKRGYKMSMGKCVKNICNREKYPYPQRPGDEMGTVEVCYEGDEKANLGYKAYFGYDDCKDNLALGGKWMKEGDTGASARRCICARNGELTAEINDVIEHSAKLPFDIDSFFDTNNDETDNYSHIGFNQGDYGTQTDCTDAEGSYYGYANCFIGSKMLKVDDESTGKCLKNPDTGSYLNNYNYYNTNGPIISVINHILEVSGLNSISLEHRPITNKIGDSSKVYCINPSDYCPNGDPEQCDESVKPLLIEGCMHGWEEECGYKCYHKASLIQDGGVYKLNTNGLKMIARTYSNGTINFGFETCVTNKGFIHSSDGISNTCFKFCSTYNKAACYPGDILTMYTEDQLYNKDAQGHYTTPKFTLSNINNEKKVVGVVYAKDGELGESCGTSGKLHVMALPYKSVTFANAQAYPTSSEFQTAIGNEVYNIGSSESPAQVWHLPSITEISNSCLNQFVMYAIQPTLQSFGKYKIEGSWTSSSGIYRSYNSTQSASATTSKLARPVITLAY